MLLDVWLSRLERLHFKSIDMGLERIRAVAEQLDLLSDTPFIFTIAGTNGKGSTVALIDAFLRNSGLQTGVYTSPHLVRFNERICINGQECSDDELVRAFEVVEAGRGDTSLTYFEFTTLAAIWLFRQARLDAWVLEVGLGGRLDAVNIWDADIAVLTSVDLDHQAWLGNDKATIGLEKIGIGRAARPLVVGEPELPDSVTRHAHDCGMLVYQQGADFYFEAGTGTWAVTVKTAAGESRLEELHYPAVYLQNAATAIQAITLSPFGIDKQALQESLQQVHPTGRRQFIGRDPDVILDVGHNPHAARALASYVESSGYRKVHCVLGILADKDIIGTLMALLPAVDQWYPVEVASDRAASGKYLQQQLLEMGAYCNVPGASGSKVVNRLAKHVDINDLILVFGSFYTVADVIQYSELAR